MEKIPESWRKEADALTLRMICAIDELVDEINTCYGILLKVQDWMVKHERKTGVREDWINEPQQARGEDDPK